MRFSAVSALGSFFCLVGRFAVMLRCASNLPRIYYIEVILLLGFCFCEVVLRFPRPLAGTLTFPSNMGWVLVFLWEFFAQQRGRVSLGSVDGFILFSFFLPDWRNSSLY